MGPIASFHLISERRRYQPLVFARLLTDRRVLRRVDGLLFARTLGTGRGDDTGPSIDMGRSALFALWRDEAALAAFLADHPLPGRWREAAEHWSVGLHPLHSTGSWRGVEVPVAPPPHIDVAGPVAVLTRASIRVGATVPFLRAGRATAATLRSSDGLRAVVGVGERPFGRLGTFSVWRDRSAASAYAVENVEHRRAVVQARRGGWFTEELFTTFSPICSEGTWAGIDPIDRPRADERSVDQSR